MPWLPIRTYTNIRIIFGKTITCTTFSAVQVVDYRQVSAIQLLLGGKFEALDALPLPSREVGNLDRSTSHHRRLLGQLHKR